jgi:hypothetical protein
MFSLYAILHSILFIYDTSLSKIIIAQMMDKRGARVICQIPQSDHYCINDGDSRLANISQSTSIYPADTQIEEPSNRAAEEEMWEG